MKQWACALWLLAGAAAPARAATLKDPNLSYGRPNSAVHTSVAFVGSLAGAEFLKWRGYPAWKATLISSLVMTAAGVFKEFAHDDRPSGNDLMANGVGIGAAAALQFTFRF